MKIAVRTHALSRSALFRSTAREPPRWPGLFLRFAQQLQDDETGRHLHDGADLLRLERFDHGPQFWAQQGNICFADVRSEEHTSELQSLTNLVCRLLLEKKKTATTIPEHLPSNY